MSQSAAVMGRRQQKRLLARLCSILRGVSQHSGVTIHWLHGLTSHHMQFHDYSVWVPCSPTATLPAGGLHVPLTC